MTFAYANDYLPYGTDADQGLEAAHEHCKAIERELQSRRRP